MFFSNRSFKWVRASARNLGAGPCPLGAFGRAAASPQTRQMRCWLSAAQAAYHSFPSLPPTKTRSLRCTAFFPPKPLRWVSAGVLLGAVIKTPVLHFFGVPAWGWYHYPRRALHAVETLDARGPRRRICRFYAAAEFALCGLNLPSSGAHATPAPNRAHSGSHTETRGVFTARDIGRVDRVNSLGTLCIVTFGTAQFDEPLSVAAAHHGENADFA